MMFTRSTVNEEETRNAKEFIRVQRRILVLTFHSCHMCAFVHRHTKKLGECEV